MLIPLNKKFRVLIDDDDTNKVNEIKWLATSLTKKNRVRYAYGRINGERILMHRFILSSIYGIIVLITSNKK